MQSTTKVLPLDERIHRTGKFPPPGGKKAEENNASLGMCDDDSTVDQSMALSFPE
jgi:hypothetical protein